jgi:hypothetical protein
VAGSEQNELLADSAPMFGRRFEDQQCSIPIYNSRRRKNRRIRFAGQEA